MNYTDYPIQIIKKEDKLYPEIFNKISKPPKAIFYRGDLSTLEKKSIAVVGSRRMTRYGKEVIDKFVAEFVSQKVVTISGFMYGVDSEVHKKTVEYGGQTIAVFGCGLDVVYPPENEKLYSEILKNKGLVISEYEPEAKPHLWKFPQRNRIVAALAGLGVLVVEAGEKSGSLITANLALTMKKRVFAIPGQISSAVSVGTNLLIKENKATLVTGPADILGGKAKKGNRNKFEGLNQLEVKICKALEAEALNIDEIAANVGESVVEVGKSLTMMSIKGRISEAGGKYYLLGQR
jgi:DNA processing protein